MTDVTKDWAGGEPLGASTDSTAPAPKASGLVADAGTRTPPAPVTAGQAEPRTFESDSGEGVSRPARKKSAPIGAATETMSEQESLLRASLETIKVKAEELSVHAKGWTQLRGEQARQVIDERPVTAIAAAFGAGLILGALLSR